MYIVSFILPAARWGVSDLAGGFGSFFGALIVFSGALSMPNPISHSNALNIYVGCLAIGNIFMVTASLKVMFKLKFINTSFLKLGLLVETVLIFLLPFLLSEGTGKIFIGYYFWGFSQLLMVWIFDK